MRPIADKEAVQRHARPFQRRHFVKQHGRIQDYTAADDIDRRRPADTGRNQMELKGASFVDNRVAGIVAATIPNH